MSHNDPRNMFGNLDDGTLMNSARMTSIFNLEMRDGKSGESFRM